MDIGTIIYIALVILYFVFTAFKKKSPPEAEEERYEGETEGKKRPASFEDMLREIRMEQGEIVRDIEETGQKEKPNYDSREGRNENSEMQSQRRLDKKAEYTPEIEVEGRNKYYGGAEGSIKNYERQPLVKLDDQVDLESDERILGEVEDVAGEYPGRSKYASMLKDPDSAKDAVILAEILNRRF